MSDDPDDTAAFWGVVATLFLFTGLGFAVGRGTAPKAEPLDLGPLVERLDKLEERAVQAEAKRCMSVNTQTLMISVYDTPNLGKKEIKNAGNRGAKADRRADQGAAGSPVPRSADGAGVPDRRADHPRGGDGQPPERGDDGPPPAGTGG